MMSEYGHNEALEDLIALHADWNVDITSCDCPADRLLAYITYLETRAAYWKRQAEKEFYRGMEL